MIRFLVGLLCFVTSVFFAPLYAQDLHLETYEYKLENGLKVIVRIDQRAPVVTSQIWYKVGSSYEPNGLTGLSHLLEHMMFKGTPRYPEGEFAKQITSVGGELNAFTSYDFTGYYAVLPATYLPLSFELEADRMQNILLDNPEEFEREKQVVIEERRLRIDDVPSRVAFEQLMAATFTHNPYRQPIIGWASDLNNLSLEAAKNWYHTWYTPNNAILIVIGDVTPETVFNWAQQAFGHIPAHPVPAVITDEDTFYNQKRVSVRIPAKLPHLYMAYPAPVMASTDTLWEPPALALLASILEGGNSARFAKTLVREKEVAVTASASYNPFMRQTNALVISAIPAQGKKLEELEAAIALEIDKLKTTLVSPAELERARNQFIADQIYKMDSIDTQAIEIGSLEAVNIPWKMLDEFIAHIQLITPEQIQAVAKKYFDIHKQTVTWLEPTDIHPPEIPAAPAIETPPPSQDVAPLNEGTTL